MNYNVLSMDGIEENFGEDGWDQTTLFPHGLCEAIFSSMASYDRFLQFYNFEEKYDNII
jgi:hypothetical protein